MYSSDNMSDAIFCKCCKKQQLLRNAEPFNELKGSPVIAAILMMFMTRYTRGRRHSAEAATLTLRLAYKLLDDLQIICLH